MNLYLTFPSIRQMPTRPPADHRPTAPCPGLRDRSYSYYSFKKTAGKTPTIVQQQQKAENPAIAA
ncbi:hypothetical protein [Phaeodactylibacter xiamenensis]|uniref:hypothetical protein n=1 Tax=Phaeodactylibacter xiamenensis TaxID=1524460 RepID=UPI003BAA3A4F